MSTVRRRERTILQQCSPSCQRVREPENALHHRKIERNYVDLEVVTELVRVRCVVGAAFRFLYSRPESVDIGVEKTQEFLTCGFRAFRAPAGHDDRQTRCSEVPFAISRCRSSFMGDIGFLSLPFLVVEDRAVKRCGVLGVPTRQFSNETVTNSKTYAASEK